MSVLGKSPLPLRGLQKRVAVLSGTIEHILNSNRARQESRPPFVAEITRSTGLLPLVRVYPYTLKNHEPGGRRVGPS